MTETKTCVDCGNSFDSESIEVMGRVIYQQTRCDSCLSMAQQALELESKVMTAEAERKARGEAYSAICPPLYRDTDPARIHPTFLRASAEWQFAAQGIGFVGIAGKGKTRAAFLLCQRMIEEGKSVHAVTATRFAKACAEQFSDNKAEKAASEKEIQMAYKAKVWFLDDLGKQRMTERGEMELYAILEHRTANLLPTVWTANAKSATLQSMFTPDRGEAIMRRIVEFSQIVAVWKAD